MTALEAVACWLVCPVCGEAMSLTQRSLVCPARHTFDVARQGYVNLLGRAAPANADTADMAAARDRFLSAGHYAPITAALSAAVPDARRILEVGAGTGHHLAQVLENHPGATGLAADISVPASRRAARAHPRMAAVVADTWAPLPLADSSVDAVLCVFAPRNPSEFARVLRPGGVVVVVVPRPDHLRELREAHSLMDVGEDKVEGLVRSARGHLELVSTREVSHDLDLTAQEATDLVAMGPNAFHTTVSVPATRTTSSVTCAVLTPTGSWPR